MKRAHAHKLGGSALVADDHEVVRFGLVQLLRQELAPKRIYEAECFEEALQQLGNDDLKLVVCDLGMPGLDGPSDLARIRRKRPDVKLVVLSAIQEREAVLESLAAGVHGYIVKTTPNDVIIGRLAYILGGEIYVPPLLAAIAAEPERATTEAATASSGIEADAVASQTLHNVRLSPRQLQVLGGLVRGLSNKELARELVLAEGTIKMHVGAVLRALGASNRAHAAALGQQLLR